MQVDMHYYGTYAMARAAGLTAKDAQVVAYAAQYVDDSIELHDIEQHQDGGMFQGVVTAHTVQQEVVFSIWRKIIDFFKGKILLRNSNIQQREVWIPFHFYPGNSGTTLSQKLKCVKDGVLAQEMVHNHIHHAITSEYGLELMGVMAHVYADTFSHYGFSGVSSRENDVNENSIKLYVKNEEMKKVLLDNYKGFLKKYVNSFRIKNWRKIASSIAKLNNQALGHGAVGTYPDRPFLKWEFTYKKGGVTSELRDNQQTFLEACEKLYDAFYKYAHIINGAENAIAFDAIRAKIQQILAVEGDKKTRINAWCQAMQNGDLFSIEDKEYLHYDFAVWEKQKDNFHKNTHSADMRTTNVYKFHQAAAYHRTYTLKHLLPQHHLIIV